MQLSIERVPLSGVTLESFRARYNRFGEETPVIFTGVAVPDPDQLTFETFCERYLPGAKRARAWFDAPLQAEADPDMPFPALVRDVLASAEVAVRPLPMRLWAHPGGHHTLFHYDGNSVSSFNLQLKGHKRWTMVSPNTPLPLPPFQLVHAVDERFTPDPAKYDYYVFDTAPGDMLFLPRYWGHSVVSCGDVNLNVNWVWTERRPDVSLLGLRERELLAVRRRWPLLERLFLDSAAGYGGDDAILASYADGIDTTRMLARVARELGQTPRLVVQLSELLRGLKRFASNNFNVPSHGAAGRAP